MATDLFYEITPIRRLDSLFLPQLLLEQVNNLIEEQHRADLLHAHNLTARNRILLAGPPGNGKTSLAEAIATELAAPLIAVRYEALIGSFLGETASRLKQVIDYAKTQRCVLFLDEFETIASSLLLQLDDLPDYVVVIVASNHPELLDKAVWRRFQILIDLPLPTRDQLKQFIISIAERCSMNFGLAAETMAEKLSGINFAEAEEICLTIVRQVILNGETTNVKQITLSILEQWQKRFQPNFGGAF